MDKRKIILLGILVVFIVGMTMSFVTSQGVFEKTEFTKKKGKIIKADAKKSKKKSKKYTATLKLKVDDMYYSTKKLKTGDRLEACANSYSGGQHGKGITIGTMIEAGQEGQHSTKLIKAKVWFKNDNNGKIKTKIQKAGKNKYNIKKVKWINGYTPYKVKVWYKYR